MKQLIFVVAGSLLVIVLGTVFVFALAWPSANRANTPPTPKILSAAISTATTPLATATTFPTTQPKATPLTTSIQISYLGTSFTIPSGLASGSENNIVPLSNEFMVWPAHTEFILHGYPLQNKTFDPQILIYPANEFARMNNASAITIKNLRNLLAAQQVSSSDPLPFFPDEHAQQIFHAREVFLSFQNGSGIRYITEFSQAAFPVLTDTYYTFQGLTRDGNYYVSIIMPIDLASSGNTPMPLESIPFDPNSADASSYPNYVGTVVGMLNSAGGSFNPNLETLDALVQSLLVVAQK